MRHGGIRVAGKLSLACPWQAGMSYFPRLAVLFRESTGDRMNGKAAESRRGRGEAAEDS